MDTESFVKAVRRYVRDAAVEDLINKLKKPPGRRLPLARKAKSEWFNALSEADAACVKQVVEDAVDEAIFGLFAVLDGSRTICEGRFDLTYAGEKHVLLNDPEKIGLNEVFNALA